MDKSRLDEGRTRAICHAISGRFCSTGEAAEEGGYMIVGVPKEIYPKEKRVALVPAVIPNLKKAGLDIVVEAGAGIQAGYPDAEYVEKGARLMESRAELFQAADIIVQFLCYGANDKTGKADLPLMKKGQ